VIWQGGCPIVAEPSHAVFLSYASQDSEAAQKIAEALRAGGIEIFLDQSELRGGDAWDKKIRHEIRDWVLFIPIVSKHTQERLEGYFRHEWNLAIERTHHMAENKAFLVPVVVDGTPEHDPSIPEKFRELQWTPDRTESLPISPETQRYPCTLRAQGLPSEGQPGIRECRKKWITMTSPSSSSCCRCSRRELAKG